MYYPFLKNLLEENTNYLDCGTQLDPAQLSADPNLAVLILYYEINAQSTLNLRVLLSPSLLYTFLHISTLKIVTDTIDTSEISGL